MNPPSLSKTFIDLNCDLGEGEPPARTRALMRHVTSVNVACGGHAGDIASMTRCVRLSIELGVKLGAHPGPWNRADLGHGDFGRGEVSISPAELALLVLLQTSALQAIAQQHGQTLHHIKLHGALYHASEADPQLGQAYLLTVKQYFPDVRVYCRSAGPLSSLARKLRVAAYEEVFVDRNYQNNGQLLPRSHPAALIHTPGQVASRMARWKRDGRLQSIDGEWLSLPAQTACIHSDSPNAMAMARAIRHLFDQAEASVDGHLVTK